METYISSQDGKCRLVLSELQELAPEEVRIENLYDRYKIWAASVGAGHSGASYKRSLDYRLRKASRYREQIIFILQQLQERALELKLHLNGIAASEPPSSDHEESDNSSEEQDNGDHVRWTLSDSDEEVGDVDNERDEHDLVRKTAGLNWLSSGSKLDIAFASLDLAVACLYRVPVRHPASLNRFGQTSENSGTEFGIYAHFDHLYVSDAFPNANRVVRARLGQLITQRRRILRYRESYNAELQKEIVASVHATRGDDDRSLPDIVSSRPLFHPRTDDKSDKLSSVIPKSSFKVSTFRPDRAEDLNVANLLAGAELELDEVSSMATTTIEQDHLIFPDPPVDSTGNVLHDFICPYCKTPRHITSTRAWRKHLRQDLKPFVCTFPLCSQPDVMYDSRDEWFLHESQHFTEFWCGVSSHERHEDATTFSEHMTTIHDLSTFGQNHASATLPFERSVRRMDGRCDLCQQTTNNLKHHIGRHLERIALFAIPRGNGETVTDFDDVQDHNVSNGNVHGSQEEVSEQDAYNSNSVVSSIAHDTIHLDLPIENDIPDTAEGETWQTIMPLLSLEDSTVGSMNKQDDDKNNSHAESDPHISESSPQRPTPSLSGIYGRAIDPNQVHVGLDLEMSRLTASLQQEPADPSKCNAALVWGPIGVGKTHLITEYILRHETSYHSGGIYWIDSTSSSALQHSLACMKAELQYREIRDDRRRFHITSQELNMIVRLKIQGSKLLDDLHTRHTLTSHRDEPELLSFDKDGLVDDLVSCLMWLNERKHWLVVFDGIDTGEIYSMFSDITGGHVILSSRSENCSDHQNFFSLEKVRVAPLQNQQSRQLLFKHLGIPDPTVVQDECIAELVKAADGLPLVLTAVADDLNSSGHSFEDDGPVRRFPSSLEDAIRNAASELPREALNLLMILSWWAPDVPVSMVEFGLPAAVEMGVRLKLDRDLDNSIKVLVQSGLASRNAEVLSSTPAPDNRNDLVGEESDDRPISLEMLRTYIPISKILSDAPARLPTGGTQDFWYDLSVRMYCRSFFGAQSRIQRSSAYNLLESDYTMYLVQAELLDSRYPSRAFSSHRVKQAREQLWACRRQIAEELLMIENDKTVKVDGDDRPGRSPGRTTIFDRANSISTISTRSSFSLDTRRSRLQKQGPSNIEGLGDMSDAFDVEETSVAVTSLKSISKESSTPSRREDLRAIFQGRLPNTNRKLRTGERTGSAKAGPVTTLNPDPHQSSSRVGASVTQSRTPQVSGEVAQGEMSQLSSRRSHNSDTRPSKAKSALAALVGDDRVTTRGHRPPLTSTSRVVAIPELRSAVPQLQVSFDVDRNTTARRRRPKGPEATLFRPGLSKQSDFSP